MDTPEQQREEKEVSFPSPARDFWEAPLSLDKVCRLSDPSVFLLRYQGESRKWVQKGAVMVVDRALKPGKSDAVVVARAGELEVYHLDQVPKEADIELWGTVTHVLNELRK